MTRFHRGIALFALATAGLVLAGCQSGEQLAEGEPPVVSVSKPLEKEITDFDVYTGQVAATETVEVRARVRGELTAIHFQDGAIVHKGDVLFEIDRRTYQAVLEGAEARKEAAKANFKLAETEYQRNYELYTNNNAAAARDVEMWQAKKGIAFADTKLAQADIDRAKLDVEFTTIKAPITGRIGKAQVTEGNLINSGGGDMLMTTIVSIDPMYVYFDVDERALIMYRERRAKEAGADASKPPVIPVYLGLVTDGDDFPRKGLMDFADNKLNTGTGTIRVRGVFPNKDGSLTPGQFARVKVPIGEPYKALLVNDSAVGTDQGQKYLLVVNDKKKVEYRLVTPGRLDGDLRIFGPGAGLKAGEWVIVNGVQRVRPGIEVRPDEVAMPTRAKGGGKDKKS
jgi:RND family efflux transporter MFP subunit